MRILTEDFILSVTCETNFKAANFLDIILNLTIGRYQPYNKADNNQFYINILCNDYLNII